MKLEEFYKGILERLPAVEQICALTKDFDKFTLVALICSLIEIGAVKNGENPVELAHEIFEIIEKVKR